MKRRYVCRSADVLDRLYASWAREDALRNGSLPPPAPVPSDELPIEHGREPSAADVERRECTTVPARAL